MVEAAHRSVLAFGVGSLKVAGMSHILYLSVIRVCIRPLPSERMTMTWGIHQRWFGARA
jgi:hypothetical protein